jgi:hypothetical protein
MADLLPIKSVASSKGSNSGQAKNGPESQRATVAPFAAINYAKSLVAAPDGSRLTSTEKNVLMLLAHHFNSEVGVAWPGIKTLAREACVSYRHCQRTIVRLEQKGAIKRIHSCRVDLKGQTTNEYFFPALGNPPETPQAMARRREIQKVARTPMPPMTGRRGQTRPPAAATFVRPLRTNSTGGPGHGSPPKESLGDLSIDSQSDFASETLATRSHVANLQTTKSQKKSPDKGKTPMADSGLAQLAWNSAREKLRAAIGVNEFKKYRFRDVSVVSADEDGAGIIHLVLRSPAPEKAEMGIAQHDAAISRTLCRFYGRTVRLRVIE